MPQKGPHFHWGTQHLIDLLLAILVLAVALATRLPSLNVFITPDEYRWVCRSVMFYRGLDTGNLAQTRQTGHPGVLTMWLGVPSMGIDPLAPWLDPCSVADDPEALARATPDMAPRLAEALFHGRRGVAIFTSALLGLAFLLLVRLAGRPVALLAGALLLIDPFVLAHSRLLHLDAISASLLLVSILSLGVALREDNLGFWALSGIGGALAAANKSPSGLVLPLALLIIGLHRWRGHLTWPRAFQSAVVWLGAAAGTFIACWPAMWVQPVQTLGMVLGTALFYAESPHATGNFFWGVPTADPGPLFYPVALAFRLTPWTMLGALLSLVWLLPPEMAHRIAHRVSGARGLSTRVSANPSPAARDDQSAVRDYGGVAQNGGDDRVGVDDHNRRQTLWLLWGFVLAYMLFMTTGQKKFDRYILPVFPVLQVVAALGLGLTATWLVRHARSARGRPARSQNATMIALAVAMLSLGAASILPHAPYYLTYYNPLLGGGRAAVGKILVGWGEGLDQAVGYLNDLPVRPDDRAINRLPALLASLYHGISGSNDDYDITTTDFVILYVNEIQRGLDPELMQHYYLGAEPMTVIRLHGIDYAWVYANTAHEGPIAQINAQGNASTDRIVVSRPSLVAKHYRGPLPLETLALGNERQGALSALQAAAGGAQRIWYIRYPDEDTVPGLEWTDFLWETHTYKLDERDYGDIRVSLWQTRGPGTFQDQMQPTRPVDLRFGEELQLSDYTILEPTMQWGRSLGLLLNWRALHTMESDYAISVKVVDQAGRVWGQGDHWIADESLIPTSQWDPGHQGASYVAVDLAPGTPPGDYALRVAIYDRASKQPLVLASGAKANPGGAVIGPIAVIPSARHPQAADLPIKERRDMELTPELRLLGWTLDRKAVRFGDSLSATLFWQATGKPQGDYQARIELVGPDRYVWAQGDFPLAGAQYPTSEWPPGEIIGRPYDLPIADDVHATDARLTLTLVDRYGQYIAGPVDLANLRIEGHYLAAPPIGHPQPARLGEQIELLGYDIEASEVHGGEAVALTLYWRALEPVEGQCTVFVHLLGADGKLWGQKDAIPLDGYYPTNRWRTDEVIVDHYSIPLATDAPRGAYRLAIGLYDPSEGGRRLPITDSQGAAQPEDQLLLDVQVTVP